MALEIIGGREAVDALLANYASTRDSGAFQGDIGVRPTLIRAMATTGSEADAKFLISVLDLPLEQSLASNNWPEIQSAALTLGFLRAQSAREPLRALFSRTRPTTSVWLAAKAALLNSDGPPCTTAAPNTSARGLVRVILNCNSQVFVNHQARYLDDSTGDVWTYADSAWRPIPRTSADTGLKVRISSTVLLTPDHNEAFVLARTWCGMQCGEGWTYRFRREGDVWRLISATFDWVS